VNLIRKKKIKEEYSLLWLFSAVVFLCFSVFRKALDFFAHMIGIDYAPAALFLVFIGCIYIILIHYSIVISKISERTKNLTQEIALLKIEVQLLKGRKRKSL
jgi:hypothetical protein